MRKCAVIAAIVATGALLGAAVWQPWRLREPVYQGKPLSLWLKDYPNPVVGVVGSEDSARKAAEAARAAGTDGIPTALRMLRARDSLLKTKLVGWAQQQHLFKIEFTPAEQLNYACLVVFEALGDKAQSAVPSLIEILNRNISPESQHCAIDALGCIGPAAKEAVPSLLRCATNADPALRSHAIDALGNIHANAEQVVPVLTNALPNANGYAPLHWAAQYGRRDVAELLLANKANVNTKATSSETPLHLAAYYGQKDMAEWLLANMAEVNATDIAGQTPLRLAAERDHKDVAELLRQHGGHE